MTGALQLRPGIRAMAAAGVWLMTVGVSPAQETWEMPDLIGKTFDEASTEVKRLDSTAAVRGVEETSTDGTWEVAKQVPSKGTKLTKGEIVHVTVQPVSQPGISCEVLLWLLGLLNVLFASIAVWQRYQMRRLEDLLRVPDRP